ncbi:MAG: hypothetical protein VYA68_03040 [Pseudomonadota bacterium]|nr:hypothetical protein [Pseudomonadota bacterium]
MGDHQIDDLGGPAAGLGRQRLAAVHVIPGNRRAHLGDQVQAGGEMAAAVEFD